MTTSPSCVGAASAALARMDATSDLGAWVAVDREAVLARAAELDREGRRGRPLFGMPIGVKDIFDTADLPTAYGSAAYAGHQPSDDAATVSALRRAGAVILGKTASTELATLGPTTVGNPAAPGRSPGGSSSGSAAAVAAGVVSACLATQTAGSIIRPAAYCGVVGYKPTIGTIDRRGILPVSPTLDTPGVIAATVREALAVARVLTRAWRPTASGPVAFSLPSHLGEGPPPSLGFARTADWPEIEPTARDALLAAVARIRDAGLPVTELALPPEFATVVEAQKRIQQYETAHTFTRDGRILGEELAAQVSAGLALPVHVYQQALATLQTAGPACVGALVAFDAVLTPATTGVPPMPPGTGDPLFCRAWTALGTPTVVVPVAATQDGLPIAIQVVAPPGEDVTALRVADALLRAIGPAHEAAAQTADG